MVDFARPDSLLVLGLGTSGLAAARLAAAEGTRVRVSDRRSASELAAVATQLPGGVECAFGGHSESILDGIELVVVSPGVPVEAPILTAARRRGMTVLSEVEYAWRHCPELPLIAVTGSNGKSTVTVLCAQILQAAGISAVAGGNLGPAACELVLQSGWEAWVLEVSSFQTEIFQALTARVAILLNLSQDHLERHPDMDSYLAAKRRLFSSQGMGDLAVLNADDPASAATRTQGRRQLFSLSHVADAWLDGEQLILHGETLMNASELALEGRHNVANALAAALASCELGVAPTSIAATLRCFDGLAHRHRGVHEANGVVWVDDSKATNVGATLAALQGYPDRSVHLILGGQAKGQDFSPLESELLRVAACVYLIGVDAEHIAAALPDQVPVERCETLDSAVERIRCRACAGQWALLSPACASFDQFSSYAERGDRFAELARAQEVSCP